MKNALSVSGGEIDESKNLPQLPQAIPTFIPAYQIIATGSFFSFKYTYTLKFLEKHTMLMYACISLCFSQKSHTSCNIKIASIPLPLAHHNKSLGEFAMSFSNLIYSMSWLYIP